jgi:hypothetical protein
MRRWSSAPRSCGPKQTGYKLEQNQLFSTRHLDWQVCDAELEAHRGYLRMDDDYLRVMTLKELPICPFAYVQRTEVALHVEVFGSVLP